MEKSPDQHYLKPLVRRKHPQQEGRIGKFVILRAVQPLKLLQGFIYSFNIHFRHDIAEFL
jgi:hypothetical protein